jgi:hypothetical protein
MVLSVLLEGGSRYLMAAAETLPAVTPFLIFVSTVAHG